jgi:hypothetical protein
VRAAKLLLAPLVLEQVERVEVAQLTLPPDAPEAV